ncbi:PIN domain-containing protein [Caldivirga maquilingensis]|uniref:PIN domain-containing protein n=1 Tax=Caldivirga maquilingensis TaxID=76887 RepID=UPI00068CEE8C|nr:PIN domain-containing protein [Caldivirga maquilingensis]
MGVSVVVFDTSALLLAVTERVDVISNVKETVEDLIIPVVTVSVIRELWLLSKRGGRRGRAASLVLDNIVPRYFSMAALNGKADDDVLSLAKETGGFLVTCDSELRRRAEGSGVPVIYYRRALRRFTI